MSAHECRECRECHWHSKSRLKFSDGFDAVADVQFLTNVDDMCPHGCDADVELAGDFLVKQSRGKEVENLAFAGA